MFKSLHSFRAHAISRPFPSELAETAANAFILDRKMWAAALESAPPDSISNERTIPISPLTHGNSLEFRLREKSIYGLQCIFNN